MERPARLLLRGELQARVRRRPGQVRRGPLLTATTGTMVGRPADRLAVRSARNVWLGRRVLGRELLAQKSSWRPSPIPRLAVVIGSPRPGRAGLPIAEWFADLARRHG